MKKRLPWDIPSVKAFVDYANIFSLLETYKNQSNVKAYLIHQLPYLFKVYDNLQQGYILAYSENFEDNIYLKQDLFDVKENDIDCDSFVKNVEEYLASGFYVIINIDRYYIPEYDEYLVNHFCHSLMIYGIDDEYLLCTDNFKNNEYQSRRILSSVILEVLKQSAVKSILTIIKFNNKRFVINKQNLLNQINEKYFWEDKKTVFIKQSDLYLDLQLLIKGSSSLVANSVFVFCEYYIFTLFKVMLVKDMLVNVELLELDSLLLISQKEIKKFRSLYLKYILQNKSERYIEQLVNSLEEIKKLDYDIHGLLFELLSNSGLSCVYT